MDQNEDLGQAEAWKRKYYDALEQQESKERQWAQADDLLRRTLSRLTLAADGQDATLDRQLKELRDAIRDRADSRLLRQRIEAMSESLVRLDAKRSAKAAAPSPVAPLQSLLDKIELPRGNARRIKALRKQLDTAGEIDIAKAVVEFAALLQEVISESTAAEKPESGSGGLLGRLFGRSANSQSAEFPDSLQQTAMEAPVQTPRSNTDLHVAREFLLHVLDQFQAHEPQRIGELRMQTLRAANDAELRRLAESLAQGFKIELPSTDKAGDGGELLLQLLERLDLPAELDTQVSAIKDRLEDRAGFDAPAVLRDIATLIADMRARLQREKEEIENFLKQLTGQLQDIDSFVRGAETARVESYQSGRSLGDAVQAQVRDIEDSVASAQSLDLLKHIVQQRLEAIIDHVEQHRVVEDIRNKQVEAQVKALTERVGEMEVESARLRERVQQERTQALTDALTGIPNRLAYQERIIQEYARWKRFSTPLALLVWDVDRFKQINDQYGHKAGDKVLKVIAGILADNIRETDFLARYGGEEFILVMTGTTQPAIQEVAEKLRSAIEHCGFHYRGEAVPITISCGIAEFRTDDSIEAVFDRADRALYRAKDEGRNRCAVAEP